MGPYCKFCDHRCFVERVLKNGQPMLMATCPRGMEHSREVFGEDHETAINPALPNGCGATIPGVGVCGFSADLEMTDDGLRCYAHRRTDRLSASTIDAMKG